MGFGIIWGKSNNISLSLIIFQRRIEKKIFFFIHVAIEELGGPKIEFCPGRIDKNNAIEFGCEFRELLPLDTWQATHLMKWQRRSVKILCMSFF